MVTQERLKELFEYRDGFLYAKQGYQPKFTPITNHHRYIRMKVDGKVYPLHRLIFLYHHGYLPKITDHANNNRSDNRIENLREVTQQQNCLNRKIHKNNTSGVKNVRWDKKCKKWLVEMSINRKRTFFGWHDDLEFAELVAIEARDKFHGSFARG